ncbi:MAG: hypothetical protein J7L77_03190 [Clostridiales bacterium]|nr:hypothetical protein [Clostridiales bacterium]
MTPFIADIIWLFCAGSFGWFVLERKKPKEKQSAKFILIIAIVSWFVFKALYRAVITTKGATEIDALLVGTLFGGIILLVCVCIKWIFTKKKDG